MSGSDLLGGAFREALQLGLEESGLPVDLTFEGSLLGLRELEAGRVQAALLAMPDGFGRTTHRQYLLAFQAVAVAVHATNPLAELTYPQLANLYRDNGTLNDWSDMTDDPAWRDRKIALYASRRSNSVALELFNALVLKGERLKPSVRYRDDDRSGLAALVAEDPTALLLLPVMEPQGAMKLLAVKPSQESQAYTPSRDNIFYGDYPLRLPFYLVVADSLPPEVVGRLLAVLYSAEVTAALVGDDMSPVPEPEQEAILAGFK